MAAAVGLFAPLEELVLPDFFLIPLSAPPEKLRCVRRLLMVSLQEMGMKKFIQLLKKTSNIACQQNIFCP